MAAAEARRILAGDPRNAEALRQLGAALRKLGQYEEASEAELAAIDASASDPEIAAAGNAMLAGDFATAERMLRPIVEKSPNDVAALRMLAETLARGGRLVEAEKLLQRALELAPGFAYARLHLAATLHSLNRAGEALDAIDKVPLEQFPGSEALRAAILSRVGGYAEAIALYQSIARREPRNVEVWLSLANLFKIIGEQDSAVASYRRIIDIAPTHGEAWWSLANLKTLEFGEPDIAAMESALASPALHPNDRLRIHFALGKAFEDRGDDERSFQHYEQGNVIRRDQLRYDPEKTTALVDSSIAVFTPELMKARGKSGCKAPDPIFIVGMPRSGSTLVEQILASHSQIEGTAELPEIIVLSREVEFESGGDPDRGWRFYPGVLAGVPASKLKALGQLYLDRTRVQRKTDKPRFLDKMPNNWIHLGFIRLILPNANIIDVRRNPLACGFSNFKQHYARGQEFSYDLAHFGFYYRDYLRLMRHFDSIDPGAVHRVIHERLVESPEQEIRAMLDYLGLPFEEDCLRFHESKRAVRTASAEQVRRPISSDSVDQWRRFDRWLGPLRDSLGPAVEDWER